MATASIAAGPGSPRKSGVWQYFNYLPEENKSVCLINKSDVLNSVLKGNFLLT